MSFGVAVFLVVIMYPVVCLGLIAVAYRGWIRSEEDKRRELILCEYEESLPDSGCSV